MARTLIRANVGALALLVLLSGCGGGLNVWPFDRSSSRSATGIPADATEYRCGANQRFYVRRLERGDAVWLIYPDREVRLDKAEGGADRYSNGIATLEISGAEAKLNDGPAVAWTACKAGAK